MEVGGIEKGDLRNPRRHIILRRSSLIPISFQFLFGFVCLCVFPDVFHSIRHKSGTYEKAAVKGFLSPFWSF